MTAPRCTTCAHYRAGLLWWDAGSFARCDLVRSIITGKPVEFGCALERRPMAQDMPSACGPQGRHWTPRRRLFGLLPGAKP
jgi:hypothetical protein